MIDYSDAVNDPDLSESFLIMRSTGKFAAGGWQTTKTVQIAAYGVVDVANRKQLDQIPEGDRITQAMVFYSATEMKMASEAESQLADVIIWNDEEYKVINVGDYGKRGFWSAIASRMAGS